MPTMRKQEVTRTQRPPRRGVRLLPQLPPETVVRMALATEFRKVEAEFVRMSRQMYDSFVPLAQELTRDGKPGDIEQLIAQCPDSCEAIVFLRDCLREAREVEEKRCGPVIIGVLEYELDVPDLNLDSL